MGGAINFSGLDKEQKWRKIFGQSVSGKIRNIFSTKDYILLGYSLTHNGKDSAGRNPLNFEQEFNNQTKLKTNAVYSNEILDFKNFNITYYAEALDHGELKDLESGHLDYRGDIMGKVLQLISLY